MPGKINECWIVFLTALVLCGCKGSPESQKQEMIATSSKVIKAIQTGDNDEFISLIDLKAAGKTKDMIEGDLKILSPFLKSYQGDSTIVVTDLFDEVGKRLVIIPIDSALDHKPMGRSRHLNLYFAPPDYVPLSKISGYELSDDVWDAENFRPFSYWRRKARSEGRK